MNLPFDLTLFEVIFIALLLFIGSAVQGVLGFGFAVIASPIIVQIEPSLVPQLLALLGLPLALRVFYREKEEVDLSKVRPLILGRLIGGPIGLLLLLNLSEKYLSISVGLIVFIAGAGSFFGWEINRNTLLKTEHTFSSSLCLPIHFSLKNREVKKIIKAVLNEV